MANYIISDTRLTGIANQARRLGGITDQLTPVQIQETLEAVPADGSASKIVYIPFEPMENSDELTTTYTAKQVVELVEAGCCVIAVVIYESSDGSIFPIFCNLMSAFMLGDLPCAEFCFQQYTEESRQGGMLVMVDVAGSTTTRLLAFDLGRTLVGEFTFNSTNSGAEKMTTADVASYYKITFGDEVAEMITNLFAELVGMEGVITAVTTISDLVVSTPANFVSGSDALNVFRNLQYHTINDAKIAELHTYKIRDTYLETNDKILYDAFVSGLDISIKVYVG